MNRRIHPTLGEPADRRTPGRYLIDRLNSINPLVILLESRVLGPDRVLSLEVALMAALSEILRDGSNPLRYFFLHELGKHAFGVWLLPPSPPRA